MKERIKKEIALAEGQMRHYNDMDGKVHLYAYWSGVHTGLLRALELAEKSEVTR